MFCENLSGSFKCLCPAGFLAKNNSECEGISMNLNKPLKHLEYKTGPESCPNGFIWNGAVCEEIDECAFDAPCQFNCLNNAGSFECSCPNGYVLNELGHCLGKFCIFK